MTTMARVMAPAAILLSTLWMAATQAQTPAAFKTLTIVVGFSAGGGYDTYARMLARHLGRHLPGQPNIIVQNMPGASSLKAVQYLDTGAPKDEVVITAFNPGLLAQSLIEPNKIQLKFTDVAWIGSITRDLRACYAWGGTGIKTWDDLKTVKQFNIGAPAPGTSSYIDAAILKNIFGIAVHHVTGYAGSAEQRLAIERGELDGDCGAWSSVPRDWISSDKINPFIRFSPLPLPGLPANVPLARDLASGQSAKEALEILSEPDELGRPYVVSRRVSPDRLAALRAAFDATMTDPEFTADAEKLDIPIIGPISGAAAQKIVDQIYAAPPDLVERVKAAVNQ
jgi:tripartite-type tricarboxylate transporter receptor subunit TctC